jgi:hypothetical protein
MNRCTKCGGPNLFLRGPGICPTCRSSRTATDARLRRPRQGGFVGRSEKGPAPATPKATRPGRENTEMVSPSEIAKLLVSLFKPSSLAPPAYCGEDDQPVDRPQSKSRRTGEPSTSSNLPAYSRQNDQPLGRSLKSNTRGTGGFPPGLGDPLLPFGCPICDGEVNATTLERHELCAVKLKDQSRTGGPLTRRSGDPDPAWENVIRQMEDAE